MHGTSWFLSWSTINYLVDVLFFLDMVLSFNTAFWEDGNIITQRYDVGDPTPTNLFREFSFPVTGSPRSMAGKLKLAPDRTIFCR